jgi:alpha-tubulin suppressor-like RCC1 family protein
MRPLIRLALTLAASGCALEDARRIVGTTESTVPPPSASYQLSPSDTNFACAIAGDLDTPGPVWCWGANGSGQLGNGDSTDSSVPVAIASSVEFGDVDAGPRFACGVAGLAGPVSCWGANESGQLGNGATTTSRVPVPIASSLVFNTVGAGPDFTCAIAGDVDTPGPVWCWGANESGQLGDGTTTNSSIPVAMSSSVAFGDLAVAPRFACGFADLAGAVWCWGANESGQLGNGDNTNSSVPVPIASGLVFNTVDAGADFACAIAGDIDTPGPVWCWGTNGSGQLGNGTTTNSSVPVAISSDVAFGGIDLGPRFACGFADFAGAVWCWGANESGQLGNGDTTTSSVPAAIASSLVFNKVAIGVNFACAIAGDAETPGPIWCWGANESGQLGDGTTTNSSVPVAVSSSVAFSDLAVGPRFACGLEGEAGPVWCWGANVSGQLGNGTTTSSSVPVPISSGLTFNTHTVTP